MSQATVLSLSLLSRLNEGFQNRKVDVLNHPVSYYLLTSQKVDKEITHAL